ncbi:MAG: hypothetical protein U9R26_08380 [Campylobacterota bacterium]|nr:hypothetical protein [Campylobacterota bacterium]
MKYKNSPIFSILGMTTAFLLSVSTPLLATADQELAVIITVKGDVEKKYDAFLEEKIKSIDFVLTDPHKRVNDGYKKKYGSTKLDILSFMSITNKNAVSPLLEIDPRLAGFNPFNLLIYRSIGEESSHIGHLMPTAILDMIGITDEKVRAEYPRIIEPLDKMMKEEFGSDVSMIKIKKMAKKKMMNFEIPFDRPEDIDDFIDDFQERFEEVFEDKEYIIAGYLNYKESFDGVDRLPSYDAFWVYSLCHFKFSYTVFDNEGGRPDAGLFAPCSMYMYIKKDSSTLVVGMPRLANWAATLGIEDEKRLALVEQLDKEIPEIMVGLGAREVENVNPMKETPAPLKKNAEVAKDTKAEPTVEKTAESKEKAQASAPQKSDDQKVEDNNSVIINIPVPPKPVEALKVVTVGGNAPVQQNESLYKPRSIALKVSKPPQAIAAVPAEKKGDTKVGEVTNSQVSAYLRGDLQSVDAVKKALADAGFSILSASAVDKKGQLTSIVFTNDALTKMADKPNRGFAASLRVLVDEKNKQITITNPLYIARGFLQDDFDQKAVMPILENVRKAFPGLKNSEDILKFTLLPKYHFMVAMPYYEDMIVLAKGDDLLAKAKARNGGKDLVFVQPLSKDRTLIGMKLGKRTGKFVNKVGVKNAALLPYPILIENGEAKIMDPKYYISVMYPMLKMSEFMKISTVPGAIQLDCENLFR